MWEETAAKHVSLSGQLGQVAALASRWRQLELASWRGLLQRTVQRFAQSADKVGVGRADAFIRVCLWVVFPAVLAYS